MSRFHALAASEEYLQALVDRYAANPSDVPEDWRGALDLLHAYFPEALSGRVPDTGESAFIRRFAHLAAQLDPLGLELPERWNRLAQEFTRRAGLDAGGSEELRARLLTTYAGTLAVETGHFDDPARGEWIHTERDAERTPDIGTRRRAVTAVIKAETFERFMSQRFVGKKRFGAEGAESLHALLQRILDRAAAAGVSEVVIGTMHRGRLGLMTAIFGQALAQLFRRMKGQYPLRDAGRSADVPYHLGLTAEYHAPGGVLTLRVLPNPSHLEAINAVALGYTRSRQDTLGSTRRVLPLILHTDASVIAQGVVSEALQFSDLASHGVGGAVNVIVNNQVGFTTDPEEGRSSRHCTAPWKAVDSLIAHVNADAVDSVLAAADLAFDYRERFGGESVVDLVCVRANGHNEVDEPRFTQPGYYERADRHRGIGTRYAETLVADGVIDSDFCTSIIEGYRAQLEAAFMADSTLDTGVPEVPAATQDSAPLDQIADLAAWVPLAGQFHPKAARLVRERAEEWRSTLSWATAEVLALGAILSTGWNVRLTGQDVDRGAFSQRHLSLVDALGTRHTVFGSAPAGWGTLAVFNSPLCEYAALGFEYGYSTAPSRTLTLWEAQFGDFANVAQAVFDQFISSGAEKWDLRSGLVVLLPHGLEGQGPEHSSARMERMLQLAAKDNLRIAHPTTPANYFHLLRSQLHETPAKPLIVFTPKKLLRLKAATSPPAELRDGSFRPVIVQTGRRPTRVLVCSGKIFYDLSEAIAKGQRDDVMVIRLEQIYPFPAKQVTQALRTAPQAEVVWVQEEPANFGMWTWLRAHLETAMTDAEMPSYSLTHVARAESPSPAGSFHAEHESDQARLIARALQGASGRIFNQLDPLAARTLNETEPDQDRPLA